MVKELDKKDTQYHTYIPKFDKTFRFALRGLQHAIDIDYLKTRMLELRHEVVNTHNIKHRTKKQQLPMFFVELTSKENNMQMYNLRKLGNNIIKCEPPHTKRIL